MLNLKSKKLLVSLMALSVIVILVAYNYVKNAPTVINLEHYEQLLKAQIIEKAKIKQNEVILYTQIGSYVIAKDGVDIKQLLKHVPVEVEQNSALADDIFSMIFLVILFLVILFVAKRKREKGIEDMGENQQKSFSLDPLSTFDVHPALSKVKFSNVAGIKGVKEELEEIVDFLKYPMKYKQYGISLPRGVLLI